MPPLPGSNQSFRLFQRALDRKRGVMDLNLDEPSDGTSSSDFDWGAPFRACSLIWRGSVESRM